MMIALLIWVPGKNPRVQLKEKRARVCTRERFHCYSVSKEHLISSNTIRGTGRPCPGLITNSTNSLLPGEPGGTSHVPLWKEHWIVSGGIVEGVSNRHELNLS